MYIVDRNQDFYDYLSKVYGEDKGIVFDRRGSTRLTNVWLAAGFSSTYHRYGDREESAYFILEVGTVQYLIRAYNPKWSKAVMPTVRQFDVEILREFHDQEHRYDAPMTIWHVRLAHFWHWRYKDKTRNQFIQTESYKELIREVDTMVVSLPILAKTKITSILDPDVIWKELANYLSSLNNDKDVSIPMTDVEKVEVHGFDKKTSFRHPVK